jgi:hypothetical protein
MSSLNLPLPLSGMDVTSFAYKTIKDRLPVILTKAIDEACRLMFEGKQSTSTEEFKAIIMPHLTTLKYELQHDKPSRQLLGDTDGLWNAMIEALPEDNRSWFKAPVRRRLWRLIRWICSHFH